MRASLKLCNISRLSWKLDFALSNHLLCIRIWNLSSIELRDGALTPGWVSKLDQTLKHSDDFQRLSEPVLFCLTFPAMFKHDFLTNEVTSYAGASSTLALGSHVIRFGSSWPTHHLVINTSVTVPLALQAPGLPGSNSQPNPPLSK